MTKPKAYWEARYREGRTGWDVGSVAPPIAGYADQLPRKDYRILLPGAGMGYEAEYLWKSGFRDLTVVDIAGAPLQALQQRIPEFPSEALVERDFFDLDTAPFDRILEYTFFCALPPDRRPDYVRKMHDLLKPGGRLAGAFFDFPLTDAGPPFGGSSSEYRALFGSHFHLHRLERATNSIPPRAGKELFFIFEKK